MSKKYHVNDKGNVGVCKAQAGNCPLGSDDEHHGSKGEARAAYEGKQAELYARIEAEKAAVRAFRKTLHPSAAEPLRLIDQSIAEADAAAESVKGILTTTNPLDTLPYLAAKRKAYTSIKSVHDNLDVVGQFLTPHERRSIEKKHFEYRVGLHSAELESTRQVREIAERTTGRPHVDARVTEYKFRTKLEQAINEAPSWVSEESRRNMLKSL